MEKETIKALAETTARATAAALVGNAIADTQKILDKAQTVLRERMEQLRSEGPQSIKFNAAVKQWVKFDSNRKLLDPESMVYQAKKIIAGGEYVI